MKSKKVILIVIIILVALIAMAGAAFAALYFLTDIFKSEQELFWKYLGDDSSLTSILYNDNQKAQDKLKTENSYISTGSLGITVQGNKSDIGAATSSRYDKNTDRSYADITLKKGNEDVLKGSFIRSQDIYAIQCKEIYDQYYIGIRNGDLKKLAQNLGANQEEIATIPDSIDFALLKSAFSLDETEKQHIIDTYSNVILDSIPKESYEKIDITAGKENGYQLNLNGEILKQVILNCLTTLKNDSTTINYIGSKMVSLGVENENATQEIIKNIDETISELQNQNLNIEISIQVYEQNGKTVRIGITLKNAERQIVIGVENNTISITNVSDNKEPNTQMSEITAIQMRQENLQDSSIQDTMEITLLQPNNQEQIIEVQTIWGAVKNNQINNSYSVSLIDVTDEGEKDILGLDYTTQIAATNQVEEIMELKNSNAVIINNYPIEQLVVFFGGIMQRAEQVLESTANKLQIGM